MGNVNHTRNGWRSVRVGVAQSYLKHNVPQHALPQPPMQANRPLTCFVCSQYTRAPPCAQCGQVIMCYDCVRTYPQRTQEHEKICFSITAPVGVVERGITVAIGGLGAVHQYVSMRAWLAAEQTRRITLSAEDCTAGVIFNDFPAWDETDADVSFVRSTLERMRASDAPYITDQRFLLQPTREARWAAAAAYKGVPTTLMRLAGIQDAAMHHAQQMLALRTHETRINYHFMRASRHESDSEVVARALLTARRWFRLAIVTRRVFLIGHIWHMVEDSFSPAHTERDLMRSDTAPYGRVNRIYFFGDQTDSSHSAAESIESVLAPGSVGARAVDVAVLALRDILLRYVDALAGAPIMPPPGSVAAPSEAVYAYAERAAEEFAEFMRTQVFALRQL